MDAMKEVNSALKSTFPRPGKNTKALWGSWWVIAEGPDWKLKYLVVLPGHRTSLQRHSLRNEIWVTAFGTGVAEVEDKKYGLHRHKIIGIQREKRHRVSNTSSDQILMILELQYGTWCDEEDIVRKILGGRFK